MRKPLVSVLILSIGAALQSCNTHYNTPQPVSYIVNPPIYDTASYNVTSYAGDGTYGYLDGSATIARFGMRYGITVDASNNIILSDNGNNIIRKITSVGAVSTLSGNGVMGFADGDSKTAEYYFPSGITTDADGNIYLADIFNNRIRKITPNGTASTIAGTGVAGYADGAGSVAAFNSPEGIVMDKQGNLLVTDFNNGLVRKITPGGQVSTLVNFRFSGPAGIVIDAANNIYVVESGKSLIRKITPAGSVSTLAGTEPGGYADGIGSNALFANPEGMAIDRNGNLFIADLGNNTIRKVTPAGLVTTIAGSTEGYTDGVGARAKFNRPADIAIDANGNLFVVDVNNHRIRKITPGK